MKKEIFLAGGCFWGTQKYFDLIDGVWSTEVGYANGKTDHPTYEEVCHKDTGHAETVKVIYDDSLLSLQKLLALYYDVIDPVSLNRQGHDQGVQYRTGIYYTDKEDFQVISDSLAVLQAQYKEKIAVELLPLVNFSSAEEYHQKYLDKNPNGYCHIGQDKFKKVQR